MVMITFLKKDELAFRIYKSIWDNRNIRIIPKNPHVMNRFCRVRPDTKLFIYEGKLYIDGVNTIVINNPGQEPVFSEDEIRSVIKIDIVEFERKKGEGKFLEDKNLEKCYDMITV